MFVNTTCFHMFFACTLILFSLFCKRDILSVRARADELAVRTEWTNFLYFQEGSAKGFAAFLVWMRLLKVSKSPEADTLMGTDEAVLLIKSLCYINTIWEIAAASSAAGSIILAIARQKPSCTCQPRHELSMGMHFVGLGRWPHFRE